VQRIGESWQTEEVTPNGAPLLDDCAPIERKDPLAVHLEKKRTFIERATDAVKGAISGEPDRHAAEITAANAEKEKRKQEMAAQGIIKLGGQ